MTKEIKIDKEHFIEELTFIQKQLIKVRDNPEEAITHLMKAEEYVAELLTLANN